MKGLIAIIALLCLLFTAGAYADETGKLTLKKGDKVYVCGCGKGCDCDTMALKPGKCACGKPLVEGKVTSVGDGKALIKYGKKEKEFKTVGAYMCACGKCDCNTISQKPGKCACGKTMKKVTE